MQTLKMDEDWDLIINERGRFEFVDPPEKYEQDIKVILKTNLGEYIFNKNMGIDWFSVMNYPTENNIRDGVKEALRQYEKPVIINDIVVEKSDKDRTINVFLNVRIKDEDIETLFSVG